MVALEFDETVSKAGTKTHPPYATPHLLMQLQTFEDFCGVLAQSLSPIHQANCYQVLDAFERSHTDLFLTFGFTFLEKCQQQVQTCQMCAIRLKNFVRKHYATLEEPAKAEIKRRLLSLFACIVDRPTMLNVAEMIRLICKQDFPVQDRWPDLITTLVGPALATSQIPCLIVLKEITAKFEHEEHCDEVLSELSFILDTVTPHLVSLMGGLADAEASMLFLDVFFNLNALDIPEFFQNNQTTFFGAFLLQLQNTRADPSALLGIVRVLNLYVEKYDEEFREANMIDSFLSTCYTALLGLIAVPAPSSLQSRLHVMLLRFFSLVARSRHFHNRLGGNPAILPLIIREVCVPSLILRPDEVQFLELYEDVCRFVTLDIDGEGFETKRKAVEDLLKNLKAKYDAEVTAVVLPLISVLFEQKDVLSREAAYYLFFLVSATQFESHDRRVTATSAAIDVNAFFGQLFETLEGLQSKAALEMEEEMIMCTVLKFLLYYRKILHEQGRITEQLIRSLFGLFRLSNHVVTTYLSVLLQTLVSDDIIKLDCLIQWQLFNVDFLNGLSDKLLHDGVWNHIVLKFALVAFNQLFLFHTANNGQVDQKFLEQFSLYNGIFGIITQHLQNPTNFVFIQLLFDTLAMTLRYLSVGSFEVIETQLFSLFATIFSDVDKASDFAALSFQLVSSIVTLCAQHNLSGDKYAGVFTTIIAQTDYWRISPNLTGSLAECVATMLHAPSVIPVTAEHVQQIVGIIKGLLLSQTDCVFGYHLLNALIVSQHSALTDALLPDILVFLFKRFQNQKSMRIISHNLHALCVIGVSRGWEAVNTQLNTVQPGVLALMLRALEKKGSDLVAGTCTFILFALLQMPPSVADVRVLCNKMKFTLAVPPALPFERLEFGVPRWSPAQILCPDITRVAFAEQLKAQVH